MPENDRPAAATHPPEPSTPRSVLLAVPRWTRDGGISAHVQASAALLAGHGLRVGVLTARIASDEAPPGVTLYHAPELFNAAAPMDTRLGDAMSFGGDLIHLHQVDDPAIGEAMQASAPVVLSAHVYLACTSGVYYFRPGQECTRSHGYRCVLNLASRRCSPGYNLSSLPVKYRKTSRRLEALRQADLVVSYSSAVDRHLAANNLTRRRVVPYSTTIPATSGSGHAARRRVVFAGRIVATKGVGVLIEAARDVDAEFVICGDGRQLGAMRELARSIGVEERVCFKAWLSAEELADQFANASVVVVPSLWPEPFGLVGIEAMAAGRPVIASATGGIGDWLEDRVTGMLVEPGDAHALARALNELLADPDRQQAMGLAGRELVAARFSPERHLAALLESYRAACAIWQSKQRPAQSPAISR